MSSPLDDIAKLIGRAVVVLNADDDMLNVRDIHTGEQFWIESTGKLLVFESDSERTTTGGVTP